MFAQHLAQGPEGRGRAFLLDEKGRVDRPRRVVERNDEIKRGLAFEPRMPRAVLMQHHSRQRTPLPLAPVRPFSRSLLQKTARLQERLRPGVAPPETVILFEMLVEMLGPEARVAMPVERLHLVLPFRRNPLARRLAQPPVQESRLPILLVAVPPAPERPIADAKQTRGILLTELRPFPTVKDVQKPRHAHTLKGFRPAHPRPSKRLGLPDRSCAA